MECMKQEEERIDAMLMEKYPDHDLRGHVRFQELARMAHELAQQGLTDSPKQLLWDYGRQRGFYIANMR